MDKDTIKIDLELLPSEELLDIWNANDQGRYKGEAFPIIREILTERGIDVPSQSFFNVVKSAHRQVANCNACGKEIGEDVARCIHCGTDQRNFFMRHKIITFFLILFVIGAINRTTGTTTSTATTKASTPEVATPKSTTTDQPIQITAKQLEQEYDNNPFAADEKYKGKLVAVVGVIITIDRDFSNNPYLNLAAQASGHSITNIWCRFNEDNASSLAKVDKSHEVTVQGICDGIDGDVNLKNCKVISISKEPTPANESKSLLYQYNESQNTDKANLETLKKDDYSPYINGRYGFSIEYPSTFVTKLLPDNGDGIILSSQDGSAELTVSGINNVLNETAQSNYSSFIAKHSNLSYQRQDSNWFAVSWTEGESIVYEKSVTGKGSVNTFVIKYPASKKEIYDSIVPHLNSSFKTPGITDSH